MTADTTPSSEVTETTQPSEDTDTTRSSVGTLGRIKAGAVQAIKAETLRAMDAAATEPALQPTKPAPPLRNRERGTVGADASTSPQRPPATPPTGKAPTSQDPDGRPTTSGRPGAEKPTCRHPREPPGMTTMDRPRPAPSALRPPRTPARRTICRGTSRTAQSSAWTNRCCRRPSTTIPAPIPST
ncbi:hypothetical protein GCM10020358_46420 [Amorphoplanes nipponensis]|uniref:Uncharacterized protein n=1 Tax=Actinoplanes nipponensis TaxID=135950 RepID=A0A919JQA0_9ACTN|nr:hypothetical protein Ani05nite_70190 [Actinoplanes nipponensis]